MIEQYTVRDATFFTIKDNHERSYVGYGGTSAAIGSTYLAENRGRIKALTMVGSDAATTVEVKINGVPQWVSAQPSAEGITYENPSAYVYQRGDVIEINVVSGTATGVVSLDTESHELIKRDDVQPLPARERLTREASKSSYDPEPDKPHRLQERYGSFAEAAAQRSDANTVYASYSGSERTTRTSGGTAGGSAGGGGNQGGPGSKGHPSKPGRLN